MTVRRLILLLLACPLLLAMPLGTASQPLLPQDDNEFGSTSGMHLFLQSEFIRSHHAERLLYARMRHYHDGYNKAVAHAEYDQALAFTDSLVRTLERHPIPGVRFTRCYKDRAEMLRRLHRNADASLAYARAIWVQDSLMRLEQSEAIREMQASYELDRLALDRAVLKANRHKTALIYVSLLLLVLAAVVGAIYVGNRRTRQLQKELLRQMKHAHESELKKVSFVNSVCHEVRTPLNSITGFAELLCSEETTPEARTQYCEIIQQSRRQLRYLFDDMLEVAFLENLHEPLPHRYIDLCTLCRTQLRVMKVKFPKPGVVYTSRIPAADIGLNTNDKYLGLLVGILLNNAYKFTQAGSITLECDRKDEGHVFIAVADTGCGIPADKYDYVFERFTKLDKFSQGNGLGLYLCRLIVAHLHGEVHIDPEYANGTRIVAILPRK